MCGSVAQVLALSNLNFDLSVYDIFGTLAAGATVIMCRQTQLSNYRALSELVRKENVTVWNSVPLRLDYLLEEWDDVHYLPIRVALISGDRIHTKFADKAGCVELTFQTHSIGQHCYSSLLKVHCYFMIMSLKSSLFRPAQFVRSVYACQ